jgi:hypothetical protein
MMSGFSVWAGVVPALTLKYFCKTHPCLLTGPLPCRNMDPDGTLVDSGCRLGHSSHSVHSVRSCLTDATALVFPARLLSSVIGVAEAGAGAGQPGAHLNRLWH